MSEKRIITNLDEVTVLRLECTVCNAVIEIPFNSNLRLNNCPSCMANVSDENDKASQAFIRAMKMIRKISENYDGKVASLKYQLITKCSQS